LASKDIAAGTGSVSPDSSSPPYRAAMRRTAMIVIAILAAGPAIAQATGPHVLRDSRGKVAGVAGVGSPCDPADDQCHQYSSTGVITKVDREKDDTLASFALKLPTGNVELQNFDETQEGLSKGDKRDLGRWLEPGMKVTVTGTTSGAVGGSVVDTIRLATDS
jgi:hypothetical protein